MLILEEIMGYKVSNTCKQDKVNGRLTDNITPVTGSDIYI